MIGEWTRTKTQEELTTTLDRHGIVCGPIYSIADIAADPHFRARNMILEQDDKRFGTIAVPGIAPKLSETPGQVSWLGADRPGKDNLEVYGNLLGIAESELKTLETDGVI